MNEKLIGERSGVAVHRKLFIIITIVAMLVSLCALSSAAGIPEVAGALLTSPSPITAQAGFDNFIYNDIYKPGQFTDVSGGEWYAGYVADAFNYGLMRGESATLFDPAGALSLGEAVALAAKLSSVYHTGGSEFETTEPYYMAYALYALEHGIIAGHMDYRAPATKAQLASLFYNSLPEEAFPEINTITDNGINDVLQDSEYGPAVYALYRSGVFTGSDRYGTFYPGSYITRAEACVILVRLVDPLYRINTVLPGFLPAEEIFRRSSGAVFMIETFDVDGNSIRTGSAFFISADGFAVTCLHVIDNASSAVIHLYGGGTYPVKGVHAADDEVNLTVFSIDTDKSDWNYLLLADSGYIEEGNTVYTIGSPLSMINTMTSGVISRTVNEENLEAMFGQVVGIASSSYSYGQNLNLAIPANHINKLEIGECAALESLLQE